MKLTRRDFGRAFAAGGAGFMLSRCAGENTPANYSRAIVIGTGFGGAVTALRLAEAGVQTVMLERGRPWPIDDRRPTFCTSLAPDGRSTWLRTKTVTPVGPEFTIDNYVGVLERIDFSEISVYNGAGVGGGSIVYGGMTVQPDESLFRQIFPAELDYAEMNSTYYPRVRQMLAAAPVPRDIYDSEYFQFARVCEDEVKGLGIGLDVQFIDQATNWQIIREEIAGTREASAIDGDLIYGGNSGYKNSLDRNYLPAAQATGKVTIVTLARAKSIARDADRRWTVEIEHLNQSGAVMSTSTMTCDFLFLAAGTVGTTRLLTRAKATGVLPELDDSVGAGFGSNGNGMFRRINLPRATGLHQACPPVLAVRDFQNPVAPTFLECAQFPLGSECNCLLYLGLGLDPSRGTFRWDAAAGDVTLDWPADGNATAKAAIENLVGRLSAGGGELSTMWPDGVTKSFTYHPLGGAVMGESCDLFGRVKNYERLYVMDGALIPGSTACANPSLTIAAIAERNIERIIREDGVS